MVLFRRSGGESRVDRSRDLPGTEVAALSTCPEWGWQDSDGPRFRWWSRFDLVVYEALGTRSRT